MVDSMEVSRLDGSMQQSAPFWWFKLVLVPKVSKEWIYHFTGVLSLDINVSDDEMDDSTMDSGPWRLRWDASTQQPAHFWCFSLFSVPKGIQRTNIALYIGSKSLGNEDLDLGGGGGGEDRVPACNNQPQIVFEVVLRTNGAQRTNV